METLNYSGFVTLSCFGDADNILTLHPSGEPLADVLLTDISGRMVTVRYWITDKEVSKEEAQQCFIEQLMGKADCEFNSRYSDITGYLWTDEEIKIGGHDLLAELRSYVGQYLILEVEIHEDCD